MNSGLDPIKYFDRKWHHMKQKHNEEDVFEEIPVCFDEFCRSENHMNFPPLTPRQKAMTDFMVGEESQKMFENGNWLSINAWGKGSGKDAIACLVILYGVYVMLCMRNPQNYFGQPDNEALDLLNVAASEDQAADVFFTKFVSHVKTWGWLKSKYHVRQSGVSLSKLTEKSDNLFDSTVNITTNGVKFPKGIRAFSGHSDQETQEGKNLLLWVLDESDAFKETRKKGASKVFKSLRSSSRTRFGNRFKGFILSFPRYKGGFILRMYEEYKDNLHVYTDKASTWDVRTDKYNENTKWVNYQGHRIPEEYLDDFEKDPADAFTRYMCIAPDAETPFFEYPEKIDEVCVLENKIILSNIEEDNQIRKKFETLNVPLTSNPHIITIDLGAVSDAAALSLSHINKENKIEFDLCDRWIPDRGRKVEVDFINVWQIIEFLSDRVNVIGVYFDRWESRLLTQLLNKRGIPAYLYRLNYQDYKDFKESVYLKRVLLPDLEHIKIEMKELQRLKNEKVDHPDDGAKDQTDTLVGANKIWLTNDNFKSIGGKSSRQTEIGTFVTRNI